MRWRFFPPFWPSTDRLEVCFKITSNNQIIEKIQTFNCHSRTGSPIVIRRKPPLAFHLSLPSLSPFRHSHFTCYLSLSFHYLSPLTILSLSLAVCISLSSLSPLLTVGVLCALVCVHFARVCVNTEHPQLRAFLCFPTHALSAKKR